MAFRVPNPRMPRVPYRARWVVPAIVALILLIIVVSVYVSLYTDLLWFRSVGYSSVFSRRLTTQVVLFFLFGLAMALVVGANVVVSYRLRPPFRPMSPEQQQLERLGELLHPLRLWVLGVVLFLVAVITGTSAAGRWRTWMLWRNGVSFHHTDPQFHRDVSYWAWTYPMQRFVLGMAFAAVVVSLIAVLVTAYLYGALRPQTPGPKVTPAARAHISVLLGVFVLLKAIAYWLDRYGLAFSPRGIVTGPSYTDVHAVLPAKTILVFIAVICAVLFFANVRIRNWRLPAIAFGVMVLSAIVVGGVYPALVQQLKVKPSAQDLEAKYIGRNIEQTRIAYGITGDAVTTTNYTGASTAPPKTLRQDATRVAQLRIVDPNVVSQTFEQLQQQRSFYGFTDPLDVDRYPLGGQLTDVVIGLRDIDLGGVPTNQQNWINQHLVYTHGFGLAGATADAVTTTGEPNFIEGDLPPKGQLTISQPRIYFGENSPAYSIVGAPPGTAPRELDLPSDTASGQTNTTYQGKGGVAVGSFFRQLLYALKYKDANILLSSGVNSRSRMLYVRDPRARVRKVAPWLTVDGDPYPVVAGGRIVWVVDGYTTSDGYPYSERTDLSAATRDTLTTTTTTVARQASQQINYIRNSVKATVDAYDGTVHLYEWNQPSGASDPVLQTWMKAFPHTVEPESAIPADLLPHLRYPEDLFKVQRDLLVRYHVTDPKSFYNGTNFWRVPTDPTVTVDVNQPPYYLTMSPDGGIAPPVYSLTAPLVSLNRRNLTGYLSVDAQPGPNYGHMTLLQLPSSQVVDGPGQVQNNIESDTTVSPQLTLLGAGGSTVIKGNLLTVPLDGGFVYVEPIYVKASGGQSFPILRKIIAVSGNTIAYQSTLSDALDEAFGQAAAGGGGTPTPPPLTPPSGSALQKAIAAALKAEADAQAALKAGDFAAYGEAQKRLQQALQQIASAAKASSSASGSPSPSASPSGSRSP